MALNDLYGVGAGAYDATVQGDMERSTQMKMDLANQHSAAMNPMMQQQQQLQNQGLEAGLPGIVGQSQSLGAKGQVDEAGVQQQMKLKQMEAFGKMDAEQLKTTKNFGEKMSMLGAQLNNIPAAARPAMLIKAAESMGIDSNNIQLQALLKAPPDKMPYLLSKTGEDIALSSGEFIQKRAMSMDSNNVALESNRNSNASRERIAAMQLESRESMAATKASNPVKMNMEQKLAQLISIPEGERGPEWDKAYADTLQTATQLRSAGSNQLPADMISGNTPATPSSKAQDVIKNVTGGAKAQDGVDQKAVTKAFGNYEPNKYIYRVGPNGQIQRKAKG